MILIGLFLIVLAGAFLLQSFGIGDDRLFEFVWPVLVALIGLGFISESRKQKKCPVCEHAKHATKSTHKDGKELPSQTSSEHRSSEIEGFKKST